MGEFKNVDGEFQACVIRRVWSGLVGVALAVLLAAGEVFRFRADDVGTGIRLVRRLCEGRFLIGVVSASMAPYFFRELGGESAGDVVGVEVVDMETDDMSTSESNEDKEVPL